MQATAIVGMAVAYYPSRDRPDSTLVAWRHSLMDVEHEHALAAVHEIGRNGIPTQYRGQPFHISMVVRRAEELRRQGGQSREIIDRRRALEATTPATDDERVAIIARWWDKIGDERASRARIRAAGRRGDRQAKIEAARVLAQQLIERDEGSSPRLKAERPPREPDDERVMTTACGARAGAPTIERNGVRVCANCKSPVTEGCDWRGREAG